MLRPEDQAWLDSHHYTYTVSDEPSGTHLILSAVPMTAGIEPSAVDILVILPPGFNDVSPDMFWCFPYITASGSVVAGTEARHQYGNCDWQRWSRHIGGDWRAGIDNLATYIAYIKRAITESAQQAA